MTGRTTGSLDGKGDRGRRRRSRKEEEREKKKKRNKERRGRSGDGVGQEAHYREVIRSDVFENSGGVC